MFFILILGDIFFAIYFSETSLREKLKPTSPKDPNYEEIP